MRRRLGSGAGEGACRRRAEEERLRRQRAGDESERSSERESAISSLCFRCCWGCIRFQLLDVAMKLRH